MRARLLKIVAGRLVVSTLLLGSALAVDLVRPAAFPVHPFVFLIGLTYALSVVYLATLRLAERWPPLVDLQFGADAVLVSAFIHLTGGITSHFSSLMVLPIIAASLVRPRAGVLQVASLGAVLYTGLVAAQYLDVGLAPAGWWSPVTVALPAPGFARYTVAINLAGMFGVAVLAGSLAERLRRARAGLMDASHEIADLRAFNDHVIDSLTSGLITTDGRGRILTFNRGASRITALSPEEARGADVRDVLQLPVGTLPPLGPDAQGRRRVEIRFRAPDAGVIEVGLTATALLFPEGAVGYLVTFQDITELRRLERESRLQQRLAAVGEMAAGMAHEIRNPLAAMAGSLEVLRQELPLTEDQAQLFDIVLRESDRLNDRIRLFLAYSRPEPRVIGRFDAARLLEDAALALHKSVDARADHSVETDAAPGTLWDGDEADVRQVLWSLGTNGLRGMPHGGRLRLSARLDQGEGAGAQAEAAPGGRQLVLTVQDEGAGIAADEVDRVFQPFRSSFPRGSGLGLAIVHRIVSDYGGQVQVSSIVGAGTTVTVRLPEMTARAAADPSAARRTA
jgi:two-component system sensor histidine kinase PilS (NtrC family)